MHVAGAATVQLHDMTLVAGATITGIVFGPDGGPLAGATVQAQSDDGGNTAITGSDGSFSINLLPPGSYLVSASAFHPVATVRAFYAATPGVTRPSQATPVVVAAGGSAGGIEIHTSPEGLGACHPRRDRRTPTRARRAFHHRASP